MRRNVAHSPDSNAKRCHRKAVRLSGKCNAEAVKEGKVTGDGREALPLDTSRSLLVASFLSSLVERKVVEVVVMVVKVVVMVDAER